MGERPLGVATTPTHFRLWSLAALTVTMEAEAVAAVGDGLVPAGAAGAVDTCSRTLPAPTQATSSTARKAHSAACFIP